MEKLGASIDIGTHTARLLVARAGGSPLCVSDIERSRCYIRLGEGWDTASKGILCSDAIDRTLKAIESFQAIISKYSLDYVKAVATGVVREALNRDQFLETVFEKTGIMIQILNGEEEALLSAKGVTNALGLTEGPILIFDLGGGSTEFFVRSGEQIALKSIPVGAMRLTRQFLHLDPPDPSEIDSLVEYVDGCFFNLIKDLNINEPNISIAGTGGTVVSLACMNEGLTGEYLTPKKINGVKIKKNKINEILNYLGSIKFEKRCNVACLDPAKAGVILAGLLVVSRLLHLLDKQSMTACMSDILEGLIIELYGGK